MTPEQHNHLIYEMEYESEVMRAFSGDLEGYIYAWSLRDILSRCGELEEEAEKELRSHRFLKGPQYYTLEKAFGDFQENQKNFIQRIQLHNRRQLTQKIREAYSLIGTLEGRKLDEQQMACIVKDPPSHLVVAGAGTGKTTVILGKVKYLLATGQVRPEEILILSFTNAAASEMRNRLFREMQEKFYVATFHKLGYDIIRKTDKLTPNIYEKDIREFVLDDLRTLVQDRAFQQLLAQYFLYNRVQGKSEFEFSNESEYREYLEENPPMTILEERVKSYGEMTIANFLTQYGIRYEYEAAYSADTRTEEYKQYHPDFFLPDYNIYIEYYSVDRSGNVPQYYQGKNNKTGTETYQEGMNWKRAIHREHGTVLIECYAYEHLEGTLLDGLRKKLTQEGVTFQKISLQTLLDRSGQNKKSVFSSLAVTVATIISLCRNRKYSCDDLIALCSSRMPREMVLAQITAPVMADYEKYLREHGLVDFTDMINRAEELVRSNAFVHRFKYVIVDEYQDVSSAQYRLLNALRKQSDYSLFCVGDDWQSIYRFAGSDIDYILQFYHYWDRSELSRIETTYRFSQKLIDISGWFIMQNPKQIKKYLRSGNDSTVPALGTIEGYTDSAAMLFMVKKLESLPKDSTVFFIGRYQFDLDILRKNESFTIKYDNQKQLIRVKLSSREDLEMAFYTAHRSKGLQADYVFILNNRGSVMGFPSKVQNPPLIDLLLESADQYPDAEERRLYYVALTRARKCVYLMIAGKNVGSFAKELTDVYAEDIKREKWSCPWCGGQLKKINGPYGAFYGCSNYQTTGCKFRRAIPGKD